MSSIELQSMAYSNSMEMDKSENEDVRIEIPDIQPINNSFSVANEWMSYILGKDIIKRSDRQQVIEKVPPLLLKTEKGRRNRDYYKPAVVSLGPYHHNQSHLAQAEKYKLITLEEFRLNCAKNIHTLYNKVFEVVDDARKCYIHGSTDDYDDKEFSRIMLHDACFVLFFIECISLSNIKLLLNDEYLGAIGLANIVRDIFLLENQIPFVVLQVLLDLRFPGDKGEQILNGFFNYLNFGEAAVRDEEKLLKDNIKPLHLLELYRSYFISLPVSADALHPPNSKTRKERVDDIDEEGYNYVKRNRSFGSVTELKAKGIFLKRISNESANEDIKFYSHCFYGRLQLVGRTVTINTKAIYLNMIAYEMCPGNPNDFRVSTYIWVMKSLVIHHDDVKELRINNIMLHSLGRDEEVVKMYDEIEIPAVNPYMFNQLRRGIEKHCNIKYKTWMAELINVYFSSPWKTVALLVASAILFTSFLQTYFTVRPLPEDSNGDMVGLLKRCAHFHPPPP